MPKDMIVIGDRKAPSFRFTSDSHEIRSISLVNGVDVVGTELTIDQLTPRVEYPYTEGAVELIAASDYDAVMSSDGYLIATNWEWSDLKLVPYGTLIWYFRDDKLVSKAYVKSVDRVAQWTFKINAMSAIGLLDTQKHYGNVYRGVKFPEVLEEIIGGAVPYTVADELANLQVYGWLPYDTRRNNLHQLLFACGVMVSRNSDGDMHFRFLSNAEAKQIPDGRIYQGGSVDYSSPASAVDVTEHSFMALDTDEVVTVYDNTDGSETADHTLIAFRDAPLHDLVVTGTLTIEESGVNWAIVTGTGILTGKKYTHSTRVMTRYAEGSDGQRENVVTVADAYLVNVANSENVAARVLAYYSSKKTVSAAFVMDGERAGDMITGTDPYDEPISGFLGSLEINVSNKIKANAKIITDYIPTGDGNNYTRAILLTGKGKVNLAELVKDKESKLAQITLISGGHGGYRGEDGTSGRTRDFGNPAVGDGGEGGAPGEGGRVATFTIDCTDLTEVDFACGVGGESDSEGTDTVLGKWSSFAGTTLANGVTNLFNGAVYAKAGTEKGTKGGNGGESVSYKGTTWPAGSWGPDYTAGGYTQQGGSPGGAAVGRKGGDGEQGSRSASSFSPDGYTYYGGRGGAGADAIVRAAASGYGEGGPGGHGGGGSGVGGTGRGPSSSSGTGGWYTSGANGTPGKGGLGGKGGPGLIMIYI